MKLTSHLYCLLTIGLWSTIELAGKVIGEGINPFAITAWRFLIGGLILAPFAIRQYKHGNIPIKASSILQLGGLGILNVVCSMLLLQLAIYYGKASLAALIISMNPLFVSLFAAFMTKEKMPLIHLLSLIVGLVGLSLIVFHEHDLNTGNYRNLPLSILFALIASLGFGLYTVLTKKSVSTYGNLVTNSAAFIIGGLVLTLINLAAGKNMLFELTKANLMILAYLSVGVTGIAYLLYFEGMKVLGAARASIYFFLKPVVAVLLAYLVLSEKLSLWQIIGMALVTLALSRNLLRR